MKLLHVPYQYLPSDIIGAFTNDHHLIWLDSGRPAHSQSRYSYILFKPEAVYENISIAEQKLILKNLSDKLGDASSDLPPFKGGLAGYWSYEFGKSAELPFSVHDTPNYPSVRLGLYTQFYYYDHKAEKGGWVCWANDGSNEEALKQKFAAKITEHKPPPVSSAVPEASWVSDTSEAGFIESVTKARSAIRAGDIFQVNLTRRLTAQIPEKFDALGAYYKARTMNAVPFGALLRFPDLDVLSFSPESFLSVSPPGEILSRPIKGTATAEEDLARSEKDRAENIMIVDLLRNDLSRLADDKSVCVPSLCHTERFEGLIHLVSEIKAQLKSDVSPLDALELCSPGGSITGAPKIESMKIIDWLEKSARGIYCGSIGFVGYDGAMETSIAIRTVVKSRECLVLGVGGGITYASDPQKEFEETIIKAAPVLRGLA